MDTPDEALREALIAAGILTREQIETHVRPTHTGAKTRVAGILRAFDFSRTGTLRPPDDFDGLAETIVDSLFMFDLDGRVRAVKP